METRHIIPPNLSAACLGDKIICYRPTRPMPRIDLEKIGHKFIAHNYGHGASGWSLGPGITNYVNKQFLNTTKINYAADIVILGAGVIGLLTAYDLCKRGYNKITILAADFDNLTSYRAGGLIACGKKYQGIELAERIALDSYTFYSQIINNLNPELNACAEFFPYYCASRENSGQEVFTSIMPSAKDVTLDFGNGTSRQAVAYEQAIFVHTIKTMQSLQAYLLQQKVNFVQRKIMHFAELDDQYIINCCGLGAVALCNDEQLHPVQGHLIMLKNQNPEHMNYMLDFACGESKTRTGQIVQHDFYLFPKHAPNSVPANIGVLGGTHIAGATAATPNEEQFAIAIQNAKKFYGTDHLS